MLNQYTRYVYTVVSAIAEDAAKVDFEITNGKNNNPVLSHPFFDLIRKPNPEMSQFQFLELHFTFMKLAGQSFWYIVKGERSTKPKQLYILRPDLIEVVVDKESKTGAVSGYRMTLADGKKQDFTKEEILHFKMPNPNNPYYGMGTVEAAKVYIETEEYGAEWTRNSIFNSGRPSGVLNIKGLISDAEFQSIKRQYKESYSGTKNAGKTMFLKGADGMDFQKLGMELGEVAMESLKNMTRDDIMVMFRVSKTMLGISDQVNFANAQENHNVFSENVIKPELDRFIDHLNAFLMPVWGGDFVLGYADPTMTSDKDRLELWNGGFGKWLTPNDIRSEMGLSPVKGGDVLFQPITSVPIDLLGDTLTTTPQKALTGSKKKEGEQTEDEKTKLFQIRRKIRRNLLRSAQDRWEKRIFSLVKKEFNSQEAEILAKHPTTRGRSKKIDTKATSFPEWGFDVEASKGRITGKLTPVATALLKEAGDYALTLTDDNLTEIQITQRVNDFVRERIELLADNTNDLTILEIEKTISEGVLNGESVGKLKGRIREVYSMTGTRAEMIARTETLAASNEGALEAYRQSPVVVMKQWRIGDGDACPACQELDGVIIGLDSNFASLGQAVENIGINYTDISAPPLHPNCRCDLDPVEAD